MVSARLFGFLLISSQSLTSISCCWRWSRQKEELSFDRYLPLDFLFPFHSLSLFLLQINILFSFGFLIPLLIPFHFQLLIIYHLLFLLLIFYLLILIFSSHFLFIHLFEGQRKNNLKRKEFWCSSRSSPRERFQIHIIYPVFFFWFIFWVLIWNN